MTKYLIGDVHGCAQEMYQLLAEVDFNPSKDELYFIGDLGCRGTQTLEVLKYAEKNAAGIVLGNNDLRVVCLVHQGLPTIPGDNLEELLALPRAKQHFYTDWLLEQPLIISHEAFHLVHAALDPRWTPEQMQSLNAQAMHFLQSLNHQQRGYYLGYKYFAHTLADLGRAAKENRPLTGSWQEDQELRTFAEFMLTTTVARHRQIRTPEQEAIIAPQGSLALWQDLAGKVQSCCLNDFGQSYVDFNQKLVLEPVLDKQEKIFPWYEFAQFKDAEQVNLNFIGFDRPVYFGHWQQAYFAGTPEGIIATDTGCAEGKYLSIFALPETKAKVNPQPLVQVEKKSR
ncbi:hypothetical protein CJP74_03795 [Psittacicella melopsittaci]|uniref:Calcineurin-like phosphoesterase domain-containing protein n=1 Tax=Psittacicella melopsittaci TaxID=2028576 RepID=A0A3A1Y6A8_9GAMM|nr:metallophosphoesterase [Psittacicella melopsittaci]RIY32738.1 hypothetical protein CJP74_03795 [Psittacicella melopsittaci]